MYTLEYDISEKSKKIEIGQSAGLKMDAILDFWSITGTCVSEKLLNIETWCFLHFFEKESFCALN